MLKGTMFALWCSVKSPLMLGSDLRNMTTEDISYKVNCLNNFLYFFSKSSHHFANNFKKYIS